MFLPHNISIFNFLFLDKMAKRRLQLLMKDLGCRNNKSSIVQNNEENNLHFTDIISNATIVFGGPEVSPAISSDNRKLIQDNLFLQNNENFNNS